MHSGDGLNLIKFTRVVIPEVEPLLERLLFLRLSLSSGLSNAAERRFIAAMHAAVADMADRLIAV